MTQDSNHTIVNGLRAVIVATMMSLTGSHALADGVVVKGNVYGGGNLADVKTNTVVNMSTGTVEGSVFGGGKGKADNFTCDKAMVGVNEDGVTVSGEGENAVYTLNSGGTTVTITNGTVEGDVYGGGEVGRVERNTIVTIGTAGDNSLTPVVKGHVFGAGKGVETHGYSALVRGNATVTIQGKAQVWQNVHGGGEKASVGRYQVAVTQALATQYNVAMGMPCYLKAGGKCTVNIQDEATIGKEANTGDVYGAGQGVTPDYNNDKGDADRSKRMVTYSSTDHQDNDVDTKWNYYVDEEGNEDRRYVWEYFATEDAYLKYVETLGRASETDVVIGGKRETTGESPSITASTNAPTVKGTVYGGSESGFVYYSTAVNMLKGTVNGDVFGGGKGLLSFAEAGRVRINTNLTISDGTIGGNVYGGGSLGDVGRIKKNASYNYLWTDTPNADPDDPNSYTYNNTGVCNVTINGGTIGTGVTQNSDGTFTKGNVYGAGKGSGETWWCEKAIAYKTNVIITAGTVNGTVYGGGQVGRVETDATVTIGEAPAGGGSGSGESGEGSGGATHAPTIAGNVFGAGAGLATHGYSALVRGNSTVTVQGTAQVGGSVYGGGETASVGRFTVVGGLPKHPDSGGYCTVTIQDNAKIGTSGLVHNVFGACKGVDPADISTSNRKSMQLRTNAPDDTNLWSSYNGDDTSPFIWRYYATDDDYSDFLKTLALTSHPHVTISENATVYGSVYGGGQRGVTLGNVDVDITGGTIEKDVYGGGALADTNKGNWDNGGWATGKYDSNNHATTYKTNVALTGGTINRNVYGGGLGQLAKAAVAAQPAQGTEGEEGYVPAVAAQPAVSAVEAKVYGDVLVELNKPTSTTTGEGESATTTTTYGDCEVKGTIFGCNNLNGSPQSGVTVHVYKTVTKSEGAVQGKPTKNTNTYEVEGVYGGGNLASYYPDDVTTRAMAKTNVIIDGCGLTSIKSVYGGGNAASVPATEVVVNGTYEIGEAFGGGNGKDDISYDGTNYVTNPGANVGYRAYPEGTNLDGRASYAYGIGKAHITIYGGTVHTVYGGSNLRGNVRVESRTTLEELGQCDYNVGDAFGGGNNADQDGDAILDVGCITGLDIAYGGASNADVNGDVILNLTNGTYGRVFGGNNLGGAIRGSIFVNIEETGCNPIVIGELYCGGNEAAYSVYGYDDHGNVNTSGDNPVPHPVLNVKSFTSIGKIFGGGYGSTATLVGNPTVNINVCEGKYYNTFKGSDNVINDNAKVVGSAVKYSESDAGYANGYPIPSHAKGAIGAINDVFGGGNEAEVIGNPTVNIGTEAGEKVCVAVEVKEGEELKGYCTRTGEGTTENPYQYSELTEGTAETTSTYYLKTVKAVDIRGNVFGGGNNAPVTGNTNVVIGKKITTP